MIDIFNSDMGSQYDEAKLLNFGLFQNSKLKYIIPPSIKWSFREHLVQV